jgi:hypothetical protein
MALLDLCRCHLHDRTLGTGFMGRKSRMKKGEATDLNSNVRMSRVGRKRRVRGEMHSLIGKSL